MDDEGDPEEENVALVLAEESSTLLHIIRSQSPTTIMKLCQMVPSEARAGADPQALPGAAAAATTEHIEATLKYFRTAPTVDCRNFLQCVCMLCENIPMHLESRLMSMAGYETGEDLPRPATVQASLKNTDESDIFSRSTSEPSSPPPEQELTKRPRIDRWEKYIAAVMSSLLRRWQRLSERLVTEVQLENVWVRPRTASRGRDRPDQTPASADRGSRTPEFVGNYGFMEPRETLEGFLQGCAGKVTVLIGRAGSGKTLLMSCLGRQWALGLGPIPSSYLFVLLEFHQLNLISHPLCLSDLLFRHYPPLTGGSNEKRAILDYLLSNPEQICWVLDGYDEFHSKISRQEVQRDQLDPEKTLPIAELISGLLIRQLLPGCTVVVTCRGRDVTDLEGIADKVGQLVEWDSHKIRVYVENFFGVKGHSANRALGPQAADLLLSSRHLLAMSSLPALCNICCICVEYLLLEAKKAGIRITSGDAKEDRRNETQKKAIGKEIKGTSAAGRTIGGRGDGLMDGTNGSTQLPLTQPQIPSTLTQVYLTLLCAFLSRDPDKERKNVNSKATRSPPSSALTTLTQYRTELCELSRLALRGFEENKILFLEEDLPWDVLVFSIRIGLLSELELRREDGMLVKAFCFVHLTVQEFLAALYIMTSNDVSDTQLRKRFSLKTRWTTRSGQRTVFTDSLQLYVCGLASSQCTAALVQLASAPGEPGSEGWVRKRQALILKLLKTLCHSSTLTGPKILEFCHCVQESQDQQLAKQVVGTKTALELRNIWLLPNDIDALAFVANSVGDNDFGLDFGACSMELECLDVLPRCQYLHYLSFHSRKYDDKFAEKLSSVLPEFTTLRKFKFCGASLTATGAASLASSLQNCPAITEINLTDNNLQDEGIKHIAEILSKLPRLVSVMLGQNNSSLEAVDFLIKQISLCFSIKHIYADGMKELTVTFYQSSDMNNPKRKSEPSISLLNQKWSTPEMQRLTQSLARCSGLAVLDLSNNCLGNKGLGTLLDFLPHLSNIQEINASNNGISMEGLVMLAASLCSHDSLTQVHIRGSGSEQVILKFDPDKSDDKQHLKIFRINKSSLLPFDIAELCGRLACCSSRLELDLLKDETVEKLRELLPTMASLQRLNVSHTVTSAAGALMLVSCLTDCQRVRSVELRPQGESFIHFEGVEPIQARCRLTHFSLRGDNLERLLEILQQVPRLSDVDLSSNQLQDKGVKRLLDSLPKLKITRHVNLSNNNLTQQGLLDVAGTLCSCDDISSVEVSLGAEERCVIWFTQDGGCEKALSVSESGLENEHVVRLGELVSQCPSLSKLKLKNNSLMPEEIEYLVKLLNNSQRGCLISIEEDWIKSVEAVGLVCRCLDANGNIDTIRVHHTTLHLSLMKSAELTSVRGDSADPAPSLITKRISLLDCAVEGSQIATLGSIMQRCPLVTELDLGVEEAEFIGSVLPSLPNLTSLSIGSKERNVTVFEKLSEAFLQCPNIQCLNLSGHVISDSAAQNMTKVLPRLRSVSLCHCVWSATGGLQLVKALGQCDTLEGLCLNSSHLDEECWMFLAQALRNMDSLCSLKLNKIPTATEPSETNCVLELLAAMKGLRQMQEIELEGWRMADRGVEWLTRLLPVWTELKKISLSKNLISDRAGEELLEALRSCTRLEELHLSSNSLGNGTAARMAVVLPSLTHLAVLDISENKLGCKGSASLSKAITCMKKLSKISLTSVGTSELRAVAASLSSCPLIQDVGLGWNQCGDEVALELARVMPLCHKLTRIDLECNRVSVGGAEALVRALQSCPALGLIRLWRNNISASEAQRLSQSDRRLNFSST